MEEAEKKTELSAKRKRELDELLANLIENADLPRAVAQLATIVESIEQNTHRLRPDEMKALVFIEQKLAKGERPTVRGVAHAIGRTSSRTGARMVDRLVHLGYLQK